MEQKTPFEVKGTKKAAEATEKDHVVIGQSAYPGESTEGLTLEQNVERMKDGNLPLPARKVAAHRAFIQYLNNGTNQNSKSASDSVAIVAYRVLVNGETGTFTADGIKFE